MTKCCLKISTKQCFQKHQEREREREEDDDDDDDDDGHVSYPLLP